MSGFTIRCNNCGNNVTTGDDYNAKTNSITLHSTIQSYGSIKEFVENVLWCELCDNSTDFKNE